MKNAIATTALILVTGLGTSSSFPAYSAPQTGLNTQATSEYFQPTAPSVLSRAEVKEAVISARKAIVGVNTHDTSSHFPKQTPSVLNRAEVKAEAVKAVRYGSTSPVDYRG